MKLSYFLTCIATLYFTNLSSVMAKPTENDPEVKKDSKKDSKKKSKKDNDEDNSGETNSAPSLLLSATALFSMVAALMY